MFLNVAIYTHTHTNKHTSRVYYRSHNNTIFLWSVPEIAVVDLSCHHLELCVVLCDVPDNLNDTLFDSNTSINFTFSRICFNQILIPGARARAVFIGDDINGNRREFQLNSLNETSVCGRSLRMSIQEPDVGLSITKIEFSNATCSKLKYYEGQTQLCTYTMMLCRGN